MVRRPLLALLVLLGVPAAAPAATVSVEGDVLRIAAEPGEVNVLTVRSDLTVVDTGTPLVAGTGCQRLAWGRVTCPGATVARVAADLGDRHDDLAVHAAVPVSADGGAGDDDLLGGAQADQLTGGEGADELDGLGGDDLLDGAAGPDDLDGGEGADQLDGGAGADAVRGGRGADVLAGGDDPDRLWGGDDDDRITGDGGADALDGEGGSDVLLGGDGDDDLDAHGGDDVLDGGEGADALDGDDGHDRSDGGPGADRLWGDAGVDVLAGGADADKLWGGLDGDRLDGGPGTDELSGDGGPDDLRGGDDGDRLWGGGDGDVVAGEGGADALRGDSGDDLLDGGADADLVEAGDGDDEAHGSDGPDTLRGGHGADAMAGGGGTDVLRGEGGADTLDGGADGDEVDGGSGADTVRGADGDDALQGGADPDRLEGGAGADRLAGGGGDDVFDGGPGPDQLTGDAGQDTADFSARTAGVTVTIGAGDRDDGEAGEGDDVQGSIDDVVGGQGPDRLVGSGWHNTLDGGAGDDRLEGGGEDDDLRGGAGRDLVIGGEGRDDLDGGDGDDHLSARDGRPEVLLCGAGRDTAVADPGDDARACERRSREPARTVAAPARTAPRRPARTRTTAAGARRVTSRGRFVAIPGHPGERIDSRLLADVRWMIAKYRVRVTDGLAASGHAAGGEHPRGLAVDLVPGPGGSWALVDALARFAEPRRGRPRAPFRWVGYDGDRNHGRGHHLHLSWRHSGTRAGRPARWVEVLRLTRPAAPRRPVVRSLAALATRSNGRLGRVPSVRTGLRPLSRCRGAAQLRATANAAGRAFGVRPSVILAITEVESAFGCHMGPSSAGAIGWTQFLPSTWRQYGMDADGDRRASPYSSVDALFSTARYLRRFGAPRNYRRAIYAYNHAGWYVDKVLRRARAYR